MNKRVSLILTALLLAPLAAINAADSVWDAALGFRLGRCVGVEKFCRLSRPWTTLSSHQQEKHLSLVGGQKRLDDPARLLVLGPLLG
ncbi:MAG: hypothetical protein WCJ02_13440 [bacterium]